MWGTRIGGLGRFFEGLDPTLFAMRPRRGWGTHPDGLFEVERPIRIFLCGVGALDLGDNFLGWKAWI
jgi:hypothetical protein